MGGVDKDDWRIVWGKRFEDEDFVITDEVMNKEWSCEEPTEDKNRKKHDRKGQGREKKYVNS